MYSGGPVPIDKQRQGRLPRTYIQQLCADTECSSEDLPEEMDDGEGWRERVRSYL